MRPTIVPSYHGKLYLVTNEGNAKSTIDAAMRHPVDASVVLFTSGMFGLNYASVRGLKSLSTRRIEHLICIDYSQAVKEFWELASPLICESTNARDCALKISSLVTAEADKFFPPIRLSDGTVSPASRAATAWLHAMQSEIDGNLSWLSSETRFQMIKDIFQNDRFIHLPIDLRSIDSTTHISETLEQLDLKLDSIYLSNIVEVVKPELLENYKNAIERLRANSTSSTFLIDTYPREGGIRSDAPLLQRMHPFTSHQKRKRHLK
jgi:hypothetical protein